MYIHQAITLAKNLIRNHPELRYWKITANNRKSSSGVCCYNKKEIQLSRFLIPVFTDEEIRETIIHEIAHALTCGHHHDEIWKKKCVELGGNGHTCYSDEGYKDGKAGCKNFEEKTAKYILICPECGEKIYRYRRPTAPSSCGKHGGTRYNPKYKLIVTQNC